MNNYIKYISAIVGFLIIICGSNCVSFKPGWKTSEVNKASADVNELLIKAHDIEKHADTKEEVLDLINAFMDVEKADPQNYYALWKIGNYNMLMGAAYSIKKKEKKYYYKEAIKYCEKAMSTNDKFLELVTNDKDITEAAGDLTINEIDAMGYWYTARFYYFKECLAPLGRVINTKVVIQNNSMIEFIDKLDPTWAGGGNYFSRGLYYIAVPEKFGGSKKRAADEFDLAIKTGPEYLVNRWGRAKYLYDLLGDTISARKDLEWVVVQDPHNSGNTYPWNVYFQEDATKMLSERK